MKNSVHRWVIVFVLLNMVLWQKGNDNPASRLATMAAMTEYQSLNIDPYIETLLSWTKDWSRGPDGRIYSNKPPGPMLLGEIIFWGIDHLLMRNGPIDVRTRNATRRRQLPVYNWILSILLQVLPFAFLAGLCLQRLQTRGVSEQAVHITAAALFFGNTAAVLMNLYFGHPMAAWCVLAGILLIEKELWGWASFCLAGAVVCDYAALMLIPGFLFIAFWRQKDPIKRLGKIAAGASLPILVGGTYHTLCFGRPWRTALQYEAPEFIDLARAPHGFWGTFHAWPSGTAVVQLIAGPARGLLFTQPWVLLTLACICARIGLKQVHTKDRLTIFVLVGLFLILIANACFGQWHGGWTIGPRYMSSLFPSIAIVGGGWYDHVPRPIQKAAWFLVGISLLLCVLIFAGTPYVPPEFALWPFLTRFVLQLPWPRTLIRAGLLMGGWYWAMAPEKPQS